MILRSACSSNGGALECIKVSMTLTYVLQVLVVKTVLLAKIIVFVAEHASTKRAIADAIANQVFRNAQQGVVSENHRKPSEKFTDPHFLLFSPEFQTRVLAFISARVIPRHHRDAQLVIRVVGAVHPQNFHSSLEDFHRFIVSIHLAWIKAPRWLMFIAQRSLVGERERKKREMKNL